MPMPGPTQTGPMAPPNMPALIIEIAAKRASGAEGSKGLGGDMTPRLAAADKKRKAATPAEDEY